jgi:hypothetical protein
MASAEHQQAGATHLKPLERFQYTSQDLSIVGKQNTQLETKQIKQEKKYFLQNHWNQRMTHQ